MRRQYIIFGTVALVLAGVGYGIWAFYLKAQVDQYRKDIERRDQLKAKLDQLRGVFGNSKPETLIQSLDQKMQPWRDAVDVRGNYFSTARYQSKEVPPEKTVLRKYYSEQFAKIIQATQNQAYTKGVDLSLVDLSFDQPVPNSLQGTAVNVLQVISWLINLQIGNGVTRTIADSTPMRIDRIEMWSPRQDAFGVLQSRTFGVSMWMQMKDFAVFYKKLADDRQMFYRITALRVTNSYLRAYQDPPLHIEMLIDVTQFQPNVPVAAAALGSKTGTAALSDLRDKKTSSQDYRRKKSGGFMDWLLRLWPI